MTEQPIDIKQTIREFLSSVADAGTAAISAPEAPKLPPNHVPNRMEIRFDSSVVLVVEGDEITYERALPEGYTPLLIQVLYDSAPVFVLREGTVVFSRITLA